MSGMLLAAVLAFDLHSQALALDALERLGGSTGTRVRPARPTAIQFAALDDDGLRAAAPHLNALPHLDSLDLTRCGVTAKGLKALRCRNLKRLMLTLAPVGDEAAGALGRMTSLEFLVLTGTGVTDAALPELAKLKRLQVLGLDQTAVTPDGLAKLAGLKLQTLQLPQGCRTDAGLRQMLQVVESPLALELMSWRVTDASLGLIAEQKGLEHLDLSHTGVTTMKPLAGLTKLKHLSVGGRPVGDEACGAVAGWDRLVTLDLTGASATDAGLAKLGGRAGPRHLWLDGCPGVTDAGLKHLAGSKSLKRLGLRETKVSDAGLAALKGLGLEELSIPDAARTDAGLGHYLAACVPPKRLDLKGWTLSGAGLKRLTGAAELERLSLAETGLTDADLFALSGLKQLTNLDVSGTAVTDLGILQLAATLPKLEYLNVTRTAVTERGEAALERLLPDAAIRR